MTEGGPIIQLEVLRQARGTRPSERAPRGRSPEVASGNPGAGSHEFYSVLAEGCLGCLAPGGRRPAAASLGSGSKTRDNLRSSFGGASLFPTLCCIFFPLAEGWSCSPGAGPGSGRGPVGACSRLTAHPRSCRRQAGTYRSSYGA